MCKHGRFMYSFQWYFVTVNDLKCCQKDEVADEHRRSSVIGICCTLHLPPLLGTIFTLWPFRKFGTIGFITTKIITCQEGVCWKVMMCKRTTSSTHASTFLVELALVNMSAMEEPDPDTGAAASSAVEADASSLRSKAHPGSDGTYHQHILPAHIRAFPRSGGDFHASSQWGSSIKSCTHEVLKSGTCPQWTAVSEARNHLRC